MAVSTTQTCKCGKPVRRIIDDNTPAERVAVPQSTSGDTDSFVYLRKSSPAPDGRCDRCHAAGRQFSPVEYTPVTCPVKKRVLLEWETMHCRQRA